MIVINVLAVFVVGLFLIIAGLLLGALAAHRGVVKASQTGEPIRIEGSYYYVRLERMQEPKEPRQAV